MWFVLNFFFAFGISFIRFVFFSSFFSLFHIFVVFLFFFAKFNMFHHWNTIRHITSWLLCLMSSFSSSILIQWLKCFWTKSIKCVLGHIHNFCVIFVLQIIMFFLLLQNRLIFVWCWWFSILMLILKRLFGLIIIYSTTIHEIPKKKMRWLYDRWLCSLTFFFLRQIVNPQ